MAGQQRCLTDVISDTCDVGFRLLWKALSLRQVFTACPRNSLSRFCTCDRTQLVHVGVLVQGIHTAKFFQHGYGSSYRYYSFCIRSNVLPRRSQLLGNLAHGPRDNTLTCNTDTANMLLTAAVHFQIGLISFMWST